MTDQELHLLQYLDGHFYRLEWDGFGGRTVDMLAQPAPEPELEEAITAAPPIVPRGSWTDEELAKLVTLKRAGLTLMQISNELNRDVESIWRKWQSRADWRAQIQVPRTAPPGLHEIAEAVCAATGVSANDFRSHRRKASYCRARQIFYWLAKRLTDKSFPQIGQSAGGRDHATVMHGMKRIESEREKHQEVIAAVLADLQIDPVALEGQS